MSTWALIVLVAAHSGMTPRGGTSIGVVNGFASRADCLIAGRQVQQSSERAVEFACVSLSGTAKPEGLK